MLKWLRRSTRSWFIYLAIGAIVVVFIFWGVGSYKASRSQEAAEVNGTVIPMTEFIRQFTELVKRYQETDRGRGDARDDQGFAAQGDGPEPAR